MTPGQVSALLDQASPPLLGVIATLRADGSPHAVPVWCAWDGQVVSIWTGHDRAWVQNLRRDPRVAFTAQQAQPPYGAVAMCDHAGVSAPGADARSCVPSCASTRSSSAPGTADSDHAGQPGPCRS
jgi:PPOX class probable F420-dependent enzyme